jgi:hypothetical protein
MKEDKRTSARLAYSATGQGCSMDISWSGDYDADGDPEPGEEYVPCGRLVRGRLDGEPLCARHLAASATMGTNCRLVEHGALEMLEARSELLEIVNEDCHECIEHFEGLYPDLVEKARLGEEDNIV